MSIAKIEVFGPPYNILGIDINGDNIADIHFEDSGTEIFSISQKEDIFDALSHLEQAGGVGMVTLLNDISNSASGLTISKSVSGSYVSDLENFHVNIDFSSLDTAYIDEFGVTKKLSLERLLLHETSHAVYPFADLPRLPNGNVDVVSLRQLNADYQGDAVRFTNSIMSLLGETNRISYLASDEYFFDDVGVEFDFLDEDVSGEIIWNGAETLGNASWKGYLNDTSLNNPLGYYYTNMNDLIIGIAENEEIYTGLGDDYIYAGSGDDTLFGGLGNDFLGGQAGFDIANYSKIRSDKLSENAVIVHLWEAGNFVEDGYGGLDRLVEIEKIILTAQDDLVNVEYMWVQNFALDGGDGIDTLDFTLFAQFGLNLALSETVSSVQLAPGTLRFENFESFILTNFDDTLYGRAASDVLDGGESFVHPSDGREEVDGDTLSYINIGTGVNISVDTPANGSTAAIFSAESTDGAWTDSFTNFEELTLTEFDDTVIIHDGMNGMEIDGGVGGSDTLDFSEITSSPVYVNFAAMETGLFEVEGLNGPTGLKVTGFTNFIGTDDALGDIIFGGTNAIFVEAMGGDDFVFGSAGDDELDGGTGDDLLVGDAGVDNILGAEGNDELDGGFGDDNLDGGTGDDSLFGVFGHDNLFGGEGNDSLEGGTGADHLTGEDGDDVLHGGVGADVLVHTSGHDTLIGGGGNDVYDVTNALEFESSATILLEGNFGNDVILGGYENIQNIIFDDVNRSDVRMLWDYSTNLSNGIYYLSGEAQLVVSGTANSLYLGLVEAYFPARYLRSPGFVFPEEISNLDIDIHFANYSVNSLWSMFPSIWGETANFNPEPIMYAATAMQDHLDERRTVDSNGPPSFSNAMQTTAVASTLASHMIPNDTGRNEFDTDLLKNVELSDWARAGEFSIYRGTDLGDKFRGNSEDDFIYGNDGADRLAGGKGNDILIGGAGFDILKGNRGNDTIEGEGGNDMLRGGRGNDAIYGGVGDDILKGNSGDDTLTGGAGDDILKGGRGTDVFMFALGDGADTLTDFNDGVEYIDFSAASRLTFGDLTIQDTGSGDTTITYGTNGIITLQDIAAVQITSDDFVFA